MNPPPAEGSPYRGYVYAYPHKSAYRPLDPPLPLDQVWAGEDRSALFLYAHVPFCTMRCGFCNLFTRPNPEDSLAELYLDAFERQAGRVRDALGEGVGVARFAVGGGTPTYLTESQLARIFDAAEVGFGADLTAIPACVEVSPDTVTPGKLRSMRGRGIDRISMGVQSFVEAETANSGRPQKLTDVFRSLEMIRAEGFPTMNLDLIYGLPGQTGSTWEHSLGQALRWRPEELYLYPLYVRPLTGLGRSRRSWDDERLGMYRAARDRLIDSGYEQISMRMFRSRSAPDVGGPAYCCQEDGMVGLGCGARSYTARVHYSTEYAVGARGVREIIADYLARDEDRFALADHGFVLDPEERRRRDLIQSLLQAEGLDRVRYRHRFGADALDHEPGLRVLIESGLMTETPARLRPTASGLERTDAIGPWLFSGRVRSLMDEYEPK